MGANAPENLRKGADQTQGLCHARRARSGLQDPTVGKDGVSGGRLGVAVRTADSPIIARPGPARRNSCAMVASRGACPQPFFGSSIFEASIHFLPSLSITVPVTTALFSLLHAWPYFPVTAFFTR